MQTLCHNILRPGEGHIKPMPDLRQFLPGNEEKMKKIVIYCEFDKIVAGALDAFLKRRGFEGQYELSATEERKNNNTEPDKEDFYRLDGKIRAGALIDKLRTINERSFPETIKIGPYILDKNRLSLFHTDGTLFTKLTEKERDILIYLSRNRGKITDRQELLEQVWAYGSAMQTHTLETHIYRLRQKIEDDPAQPRYLLTKKNGYILS